MRCYPSRAAAAAAGGLDCPGGTPIVPPGVRAREVRCGHARHTRGARRAGLGGGRRVVHAYRGMRSALISLADCRAERRPLGSGPGVREAVRVASPRRESRRPPLVTRTSRRESLRAPIGAALEAGDCAHALRCPVVLRRPPGWGAQRPQAQAGAPSDSRRSISYTAAA